MSDRCRTCGEWIWPFRAKGNHCCPPKYYVWWPYMDISVDDPWVVYSRLGASGAAEEFAERFDSDGDYPIIRAGSAKGLLVRREGEDAIWKVDVFAESVPSYSSSNPVEHKDVG